MTTTQEPVLDKNDYIAEAIANLFFSLNDPEHEFLRLAVLTAIAAPAAVREDEAVAKVLRKGFSAGDIILTQIGYEADLTDGTMLYTRPASQAPGVAATPSALSMSDGVITAAYDRDEDAARAYGFLESGFTTPPAQSGTVEALRDENDRLRKVISKVCAALPNGAFCDQRCSVEFMEMVPAEVATALAALQSQPIALASGNAGLRGAAQIARESAASTLDVSIPDAPVVTEADLETQAWECDKWPAWLHAIVDRTNEVADRLHMSSEQAHAYAVLSALSKQEPVGDAVERAANILAQADGCQGILPKHRNLASMILAAIGKESGWRPMECAPKDGTEVIYLSANGARWIGNQPPGYARGIWWRSSDGTWSGRSQSRNDDVAWHPLPAAPQQGAK